MDPVLVLPATPLAVDPGSEARLTVKIRNAGSRVEEYALQILGPAAAWSEVVPPTVSVYPGTDVEVTAVFRPPRGPTTPSGTVPFGVLCQSREDADASAVGEGELTIAGTLVLAAELTPRESRGRWRGRHRVEFENGGSTPVRLKVVASDPAEALSFALAPDVLEVPAGGKAHAFLKVRTREPFLRGALTPRRFQVSYTRLLTTPSESAGDAGVDGTFNQKPILSKFVVSAAALAVIAIVALVAVSLMGKDKKVAEQPALPLERPPLRSVEGIANGAQLAWEPDPNATSYLVQLVQPKGSDVLGSNAAKDGQNTYTWTGLQPGPYCFRLVAQRDKLKSDPSVPRCATALPPASLAAPTNVKLQANGADVHVEWKGSADATYLVFVTGAPFKLPETEKGILFADTQITEPPGEYCFMVMAKKDNQASPLSTKSCVSAGDPTKTKPTPSSAPNGNASSSLPGATGPGGVALPGGSGGTATGSTGSSTPPTTIKPSGWWVTELYAATDKDPNYEGLKQDAAKRAEFINNLGGGYHAGVAPGAAIGKPGSGYYVYADGFGSQSEAMQFCNSSQPVNPCTVETPLKP